MSDTKIDKPKGSGITYVIYINNLLSNIDTIIPLLYDESELIIISSLNFDDYKDKCNIHVYDKQFCTLFEYYKFVFQTSKNNTILILKQTHMLNPVELEKFLNTNKIKKSKRCVISFEIKNSTKSEKCYFFKNDWRMKKFLLQNDKNIKMEEMFYITDQILFDRKDAYYQNAVINYLQEKTKISFLCSWDDEKTINSKCKLFTPSNHGIWNNIEITDSKIADTIVILDDMIINDVTKDLLETKNVIYIQREGKIIKDIPKSLLKTYKINKLLTFENMFRLTTYPQFIELTYDELKNLEYKPKTKKMSCIVSKKSKIKTHKKRVDFIIALSKRFPNMIDIYGFGWSVDDLGDNYKGELGAYHKIKGKDITTKKDGLIDYEYTIAIENSVESNYFTEKFDDSILCWSIPIYHGCPEISAYFPEQSFVKINIDDYEESFRIIENILNEQINNSENIIKKLQQARTLILDKYNIMNVLDMYISKNYNTKNTKELLLHNTNPAVINLTNVINPLRFDIAAKIIYVKYFLMNLKTKFHKELYESHILVINDGIEPDNRYSNSTKVNISQFIPEFDKLINSMKETGYNGQFPIVIGKNGILMDGSHRFSTAYVLGIKSIVTNESVNGAEYDYEFFRKRNKGIYSEMHFDTMALEFVKMMQNSYVLVNYPVCKDKNKDFDIKNIIKCNKGTIFYTKIVNFNSTGFKNLLHELYRGESWIGGLFPSGKDCGGKFKVSYSEGETNFYFFTCEDFKNVLNIKEESRKLFGIGKHSLHINDTHEEAVRISSSILNENSIHFMNNCDINLNNNTQNKLKEYFNAIKTINKCGYGVDNFCIDSSLILELYNLRKANDIDYISYDETILNCDAHLRDAKYLAYYGKTKDDILFNPSNYFYINGFKFTTLKLVYEMKKNRNEPKDIIDCGLISDNFNHLV